MSYPLIVSFYTPDKDYPEHAAKLKADCGRLDLEYCIEERPSTGDYFGNTAIKPSFILDMLQRHKRNIIWVDCDCSLCKTPTLLEEPFSFDLALCKKKGKLLNKWHVGTIGLAYNQKVLTFMQTWIKEASDQGSTKYNRIGDHTAFVKVLPKFLGVLNITYIPKEYCLYFEKDLPENAYIAHRISGNRDDKELGLC
jgi:hypothetical protein